MIDRHEPKTHHPAPVRAVFVSRPNRFLVHAELADGSIVAAHLPNTGRLAHLAVPGRPMILRPEDDPSRKTAYTATRAWDACWVALEAARATDLVFDWLRSGNPLPGFGSVDAIEREVTAGAHRIDLRASREGDRDVWIEVKSSGRVVDGEALLSQTPSVRGAGHLATLADLAARGAGAVVAFVVQRPDARSMRIWGDADPGWVAAVRGAAKSGVDVLAFGCEVTVTEVGVSRPLPVHWDGP